MVYVLYVHDLLLYTAPLIYPNNLVCACLAFSHVSVPTIVSMPTVYVGLGFLRCVVRLHLYSWAATFMGRETREGDRERCTQRERKGGSREAGTVIRVHQQLADERPKRNVVPCLFSTEGDRRRTNMKHASFVPLYEGEWRMPSWSDHLQNLGHQSGV